MSSLTIDLKWGPFLSKQWEAFNWEPPAGTRQVTEGLLGGWGAGKTDGAARMFVKRVLGNGWRPDYGDKQPISYVCAPTWRIMRQTTMPALEAVFPKEAIKTKRKSPVHEWELVNGHKILFVSAESEVEGFSACVGWIDEIQHNGYWNNPRKVPNLTARIRDPKSTTRSMILSGLPESGPVRDTFDRPDDPSCHIVLTGTRDNVYLDDETIANLLATCPAGYEDSFIGGNWLMPIGAIYSQYDTEKNLTNRRGNENAVTHIGMDVGNGGAMIFGQDNLVQLHDGQKGAGLDIVDEMLTADLSVEEMCLRVKAELPWKIIPGQSVICTDPNLDRDEKRAIKRVFGDVRIVRCERADDAFPVETGIRWMQRGLRDAHQDTRLRFWSGLSGTQYGILDGIQRYRRNEYTGRPIKDNLRDHALDAARYLVAERIRPDKFEARVIRGRR